MRNVHNAALIPRETGTMCTVVVNKHRATWSTLLLLQHHLLPTPYNGPALLTLNPAVTFEAFPPEQFIKRGRLGVKDCFVWLASTQSRFCYCLLQTISTKHSDLYEDPRHLCIENIMDAKVCFLSLVFFGLSKHRFYMLRGRSLIRPMC